MRAHLTFRETFGKVDPNFLRWFPGHMSKGMRQIQQQLKSVDVAVEVHDARIPFSGRNPNFKTITGVKPHILVLNKVDLADEKYNSAVEKKLKDQGISQVLYMNSKKPDRDLGFRQLVPTIEKLVNESFRYNRTFAEELTVLIFGVPNVGKSTLMNSLRSQYAFKAGSAPVGSIAGITRAIQNRVKISHVPPIYVLDTPGILAPSLGNPEAALRLASCSSLQDHLVGEILIADYILFWLNKHRKFGYVRALKLDKPYDSVDHMLAVLAIERKLTRRLRDPRGVKLEVPCLDSAAKLFIKAFRTNQLGPIMLDTDYL